MNESQQQPQQKRVMPQSELDFNLMITDSVWGRHDVSPELKDKLNKYFMQENPETGEKFIGYSSLWGLLGYYTRDMRLGNLSTWDGELQYCSYYLDLANDFLQAEMIEPFLICLSRVATRLELSQSKGGFLRRLFNTLRTEQMVGELEPPKKGLFGVGKDKNQQGGRY